MLGEYLHHSWPLLQLAKRNGIRFFAHAHGYDLSVYWQSEKWRRRYREYADADGIIVVNQAMRRRMLEAGVSDGRLHIVRYGVDLPKVRPVKPLGDICKWLAVGRMVPKKAPLKTLEAFRIACRARPNIQLDFVGAGPLFGEALAYVEEHKLGRNVTLHGAQPHGFVLKLLTKADAFVQHSMVDPYTGDEEGAPVAIMEAMAHGLPVVSTNHAGIPEIVRHGITGLLVEEGDARKMAVALRELTDKPAIRSRLGDAGWQLAHEEFGWEVERERLRGILGL
jgi:glycosyltransferase involved in cell wall biosynthesis